MLGKHIREIIGEERYILNLPYIQGALRGEVQHFERAIATPDGKGVRHAQAVYIPDIAEGGVQGFFVEVTDITSQKNAESLIASEERYRSLVEQAADGIFVADANGYYIDVNSTGCKMLGYSRQELLNLNIANAISPTEIPRIGPEVARFADGSVVVSEWQFLRKDGSLFYGEVRGRQLSNGNLQAILIDITERRKIEQELIDLNNTLAEEIASRTSDLSALTAHIQKVAETERAKLARELHDEMGSIMTALSMEVGRLQRKASAPDLLSDLTVVRDLISKAIQSKRNIVNQLYPTVLDDYGFAHAVNLMVKEYRKHTDIDVEIIMPKEDIVMATDYALVAYRITQECLTNIAKHAGASKVQIEATIRNGFLDLTIHDNGKGMPSEISHNRHGIFGMIERARYLGGSLEISSNGRQGTTAHLVLPLDVAKPKQAKRVLVVDDHAIFRDGIRQLIEREANDFSVEGEATDGMAALQMAIDEEWDIILLDINLPKKNGMEVLEAIKQIKANLPIIMLSSQAESEYGEKARAKGASCYIEKGESVKLVEAMRQATSSNE